MRYLWQIGRIEDILFEGNFLLFLQTFSCQNNTKTKETSSICYTNLQIGRWQMIDFLIKSNKKSSKRISNSKRKLRIEGAKWNFLVNKILSIISFGNSYGNSYGNSFCNSFCNSFGIFFWIFFWNYFWNFFENYIGNSFGNSFGFDFLCRWGFVGVQVLVNRNLT